MALSTSPMVAIESVSNFILSLGTEPPGTDIKKSEKTMASLFENESFGISGS